MGAIVEHAFSLLHLDEEGTLSFVQFIRCADSREDTIDNLAFITLSWHVRAHLSQNDC
jgi:hypothetical protein